MQWTNPFPGRQRWHRERNPSGNSNHTPPTRGQSHSSRDGIWPLRLDSVFLWCVPVFFTADSTCNHRRLTIHEIKELYDNEKYDECFTKLQAAEANAKECALPKNDPIRIRLREWALKPHMVIMRTISQIRNLLGREKYDECFVKLIYAKGYANECGFPGSDPTRIMLRELTEGLKQRMISKRDAPKPQAPALQKPPVPAPRTTRWSNHGILLTIYRSG